MIQCLKWVGTIPKGRLTGGQPMATVTAEQSAISPESEDFADFFEIIDGQRVESPPMGAHEVWLANQFLVHLANFARAHDLGQAVVEMLFDLRPTVNRSRRPD